MEINLHNLCTLSNFTRKQDVLETSSVSIFCTKKNVTCYIPLTKLLPITCQHNQRNLLRYVPENRYSPWVVTGQWLLKNYRLLQDTKIKPGPIHKLKTIKGGMNSD